MRPSHQYVPADSNAGSETIGDVQGFRLIFSLKCIPFSWRGWNLGHGLRRRHNLAPLQYATEITEIFCRHPKLFTAVFRVVRFLECIPDRFSFEIGEMRSLFIVGQICPDSLCHHHDVGRGPCSPMLLDSAAGWARSSSNAICCRPCAGAPPIS